MLENREESIGYLVNKIVTVAGNMMKSMNNEGVILETTCLSFIRNTKILSSLLVLKCESDGLKVSQISAEELRRRYEECFKNAINQENKQIFDYINKNEAKLFDQFNLYINTVGLDGFIYSTGVSAFRDVAQKIDMDNILNVEFINIYEENLVVSRIVSDLIKTDESINEQNLTSLLSLFGFNEGDIRNFNIDQFQTNFLNYRNKYGNYKANKIVGSYQARYDEILSRDFYKLGQMQTIDLTGSTEECLLNCVSALIELVDANNQSRGSDFVAQPVNSTLMARRLYQIIELSIQHNQEKAYQALPITRNTLFLNNLNNLLSTPQVNNAQEVSENDSDSEIDPNIATLMSFRRGGLG